jgi:hypothetical protein
MESADRMQMNVWFILNRSICVGLGLTDDSEKLTIRCDTRLVRRRETYQGEQIGEPEGKAGEN